MEGNDGIPFLDMDPKERTELIHRMYADGTIKVPGAAPEKHHLVEDLLGWFLSLFD